MFLSDLSTSQSLKPGVSINVTSPTVPCCTHGVTDLKDFILLNVQVYAWPLKYFSDNSVAILFKTVDLP